MNYIIFLKFLYKKKYAKRNFTILTYLTLFQKELNEKSVCETII